MPTRHLALVVGIRGVSRSTTPIAAAGRSAVRVRANVWLMVWALAATTACGPRHVATATAPDPGPAVAAATRALDAGSCVALHEALAELQHARSAGASPTAIDPLVVQVSAVLDIREVELGLVQHRHLDTLATPPDQPDLVSIVEFAAACAACAFGELVKGGQM